MQKNNTRENKINFSFPSCQSSATFKYFFRKITKFILLFYYVNYYWFKLPKGVKVKS